MKNSTKALQTLKEKISKLEIHILFLYGLIILIVLGFIVSGVAKSANPPQATQSTKATLDKQESILQYNLPVKKPVDKNFWDSALNDGECGC